MQMAHVGSSASARTVRAASRGRKAEGEGCALRRGEDGGQLVLLGFDVAVFAPAAYQRRSLRRPCEI